MKYLAALLVWATLATRVAVAQCCLGAQDISSDSVDGRFRVEATTLNGKFHHGPFHYRFTTYEKNSAGELKKLDSFEKKWELEGHGTMKLMVSPLGNGFAFNFPSPTLTFYRRDGRESFTLTSHTVLVPPGEDTEEASSKMRWYELSDNGHNASICMGVEIDHAGCEIEESSVFLPLGLESNRLLDGQIRWYLIASPDKFRRAQSFIAESIDKLVGTDDKQSDRATKDLLHYTIYSIPKLEKALKDSPDGELEKKLQKLVDDLTPWQPYVGEVGWRDLELIDSALFYPDSAIQKAAREKLTFLIELPKEVSKSAEIHDWLTKHRHELKWNAAKDKYERPAPK